MPECSVKTGQDSRRTGRADSLAHVLPWVWPHALSMGTCQGLMLVPFLLGPLGMGLGVRLWDEPQYTCCFFVAVVLSMLYDDAASRHGVGGRGLLRFTLKTALVFVAGGVLLVAHALIGASVMAAGLGCAGAVLMGFSTACAQLASARFMASLSARRGVYVVLVSMVPSALVLAFAGACKSPWWGMVLAVLPVVGYGFMRYAEKAGGCLAEAPAHMQPREILGTVTLQGATRAGLVSGSAVALGAFAIFAVRRELTQLGLASAGVDAGFAVAFVCGLCAVVAAVGAGLCFKTRTFSMTFVFRIALPCLIAGALLVGLLQPSVESVPGYWMATFASAAAMLFIDQIVWVSTASVVRCDPEGGDCMVTRFRMFEFAGAALGAALAVPAVVRLGTLETMFVATALLAVAFVVCIPTYEARVVSAGAVGPGFDSLDENDHRRYSVAFARFGLTAREAEVACLLIEGLDAPAMARRLCVSRATVNTHVRHIYEKMGVHARDEMVAAVVAHP